MIWVWGLLIFSIPGINNLYIPPYCDGSFLSENFHHFLIGEVLQVDHQNVAFRWVIGTWLHSTFQKKSTTTTHPHSRLLWVTLIRIFGFSNSSHTSLLSIAPQHCGKFLQLALHGTQKATVYGTSAPIMIWWEDCPSLHLWALWIFSWERHPNIPNDWNHSSRVHGI